MSAPTRLPPAQATPPLGQPERARSIADTLAHRPAGRADGADAIRVFAYGSLIWNPGFAWTGRMHGRLSGYMRRACIWTLESRGTPENPGLALGLDTDPSGSCAGIVFTLPLDGEDEVLDRLWQREMHTALYRPRWLTASTEAGPADVLAFVSNREHPQYAGVMAHDVAAGWIRGAEGAFGRCADYFRQTLRSLEAEGLDDPGLADLVLRIDGSRGDR
ncbi:MAG: gamma-glutamylcyclotransferase [Alphaproteobacteria bacterium]|nr:gamma-glutamylcyclotransferase [Alphaproteobacteria bacterium]